MPNNQCKVLLIEDQASDAALFQEMLAEAPQTQFVVTCCRRLAQALELLAESSDKPDVVLLDLSLPDSAGLETLSKLHQAAPELPIVVLTGMADEKIAVEAIRAGAQDWVAKNQTDCNSLERSLRYALDRNRMALDLRSSEERFRELAENINEVFWSYDVSARQVLYVSPAYEKVWGRKRQELYDSPDDWLTAVHPEERAIVREQFEQGAILGQFDIEYRVVRPDGTVRWIHDTGVPVRDQRGNVYRIAGIAEDITRYRELEREIAESTVSEQRRIGQQLHDSLGQQLTGVALLALTLQRRLEQSGIKESAAAADLVQNIAVAQTQLRQLIKGIMPVQVDAAGLMDALEQLAGATEAMCSVSCTFDCGEPVEVEDNDTATQMFHIAQEALNNAVRHASASQIRVRLAKNNGAVILEVHDNGKGMNGGLPKSKGMGTRIMRHRASVIGAAFDIRSGQPNGTIVTCSLRLDENHGKTS